MLAGIINTNARKLVNALIFKIETVFENSKLPLQKWFYAFYFFN